MDRERIVQLFFFGFLAVMAYELYELMLPFLTPLAWGILLAFMAHPALIEVEKYVKRRSLSTAIISVVVALGVILPAIWASSRLVAEAQSLYVQATQMVNTGGVTKLHDWAVNTQLGAWIAKKMGERGYKLDEELPKLTLQAAQITSDYVAKNATSAAKNMLGFIVDFGIALLAFFYLLRDGDFYYRGLRDLTPLHEDDKKAIFDTLRTTLSSVMRGLMLTAVLQGVSIGIGMLIFGVPYWLFLAIASAAAGLMPIGGTALIWIPATIYLGFAASWSAASRPGYLVCDRAGGHRQFHQASRDEARHRLADDRALPGNSWRPRSLRSARPLLGSRDHVGLRSPATRLPKGIFRQSQRSSLTPPHRSHLLGAGVTPAQGSMKPTVGFI